MAYCKDASEQGQASGIASNGNDERGIYSADKVPTREWAHCEMFSYPSLEASEDATKAAARLTHADSQQNTTPAQDCACWLLLAVAA